MFGLELHCFFGLSGLVQAIGLAAARHHAFRLDLGLVIDFWFCVAAFGLMKTAQWWRHRREG